MNSVDLVYCGYISTRVSLFKVKSDNPYKANMRCPVCNDSEKSKTKCRGWLVENQNTVFYNCFNCGVKLHLSQLLKTLDLSLYNQYIIDHKLQKISSNPIVIPKKVVKKLFGINVLESLKKVSSLDWDHPVKKYVENRKIPTDQHYRLYFAPKYNRWVNSIIPEKLSDNFDEPRLVIPFFDEKGLLFGFAGRSFDKTSLRYVTIMLDETKPKMFGLELVDFKKQYYVIEGQLDSLFLNNSIAMAGADGNLSSLKNLENAVFCFDNERRNSHIVARMNKILSLGYKVCIWDTSIQEKDINDMVLSGKTKEEVKTSIDRSIYSGLSGTLKLSEWRQA